jgi:hypothetical protein
LIRLNIDLGGVIIRIVRYSYNDFQVNFPQIRIINEKRFDFGCERRIQTRNESNIAAFALDGPGPGTAVYCGCRILRRRTYL